MLVSIQTGHYRFSKSEPALVSHDTLEHISRLKVDPGLGPVTALGPIFRSSLGLLPVGLISSSR